MTAPGIGDWLSKNAINALETKLDFTVKNQGPFGRLLKLNEKSRETNIATKSLLYTKYNERLQTSFLAVRNAKDVGMTAAALAVVGVFTGFLSGGLTTIIAAVGAGGILGIKKRGMAKLNQGALELQFSTEINRALAHAKAKQFNQQETNEMLEQLFAVKEGDEVPHLLPQSLQTSIHQGGTKGLKGKSLSLGEAAKKVKRLEVDLQMSDASAETLRGILDATIRRNRFGFSGRHASSLYITQGAEGALTRDSWEKIVKDYKIKKINFNQEGKAKVKGWDGLTRSYSHQEIYGWHNISSVVTRLYRNLTEQSVGNPINECYLTLSTGAPEETISRLVKSPDYQKLIKIVANKIDEEKNKKGEQYDKAVFQELKKAAENAVKDARSRATVRGHKSKINDLNHKVTNYLEDGKEREAIVAIRDNTDIDPTEQKDLFKQHSLSSKTDALMNLEEEVATLSAKPGRELLVLQTIKDDESTTATEKQAILDANSLKLNSLITWGFVYAYDYDAELARQVAAEAAAKPKTT